MPDYGPDLRGSAAVTPPPAERHSDVPPWDESTRPRAPAPRPGTGYTDQGRAAGQHLVDVHDHLRQERELVEPLARLSSG